jgi:hypothetical protein
MLKRMNKVRGCGLDLSGSGEWKVTDDINTVIKNGVFLDWLSYY